MLPSHANIKLLHMTIKLWSHSNIDYHTLYIAKNMDKCTYIFDNNRNTICFSLASCRQVDMRQHRGRGEER